MKVFKNCVSFVFPLPCMFLSKGPLKRRGWRWDTCVIHPDGKKALCLHWRGSARGSEVVKDLFLDEKDWKFKSLLWKEQILGFLHPRGIVASGVSLFPSYLFFCKDFWVEPDTKHENIQCCVKPDLYLLHHSQCKLQWQAFIWPWAIFLLE